MVRNPLWSAVLLAGGCTVNSGTSMADPDTAGSVAAGATSPNPETTDPAETEPAGPSSQSDGMSDDVTSVNDTSTALTPGPAWSTSDVATSATNDAGDQVAVSCDVRKLTCKRAEPSCDYGYVPRIVAGCYAECVRIDDCVCNGPDACPQHERYTCNNSRQRCTPYLR